MLVTKRNPLAVTFGLLGVIALSIIPGALGATTWLAPERPFTDAQWLEYDVCGADAVGFGHVIAVRDTIVNVDPKAGGFRVRSFTLLVTKWLKGQLTEKNVLEVGISPMDVEPVHRSNQTLAGLPWADHSVLFMLRYRNGGWGLCDGPDPAGAGLRIVAPSELAEVEDAVRRIVSQETGE